MRSGAVMAFPLWKRIFSCSSWTEVYQFRASRFKGQGADDDGPASQLNCGCLRQQRPQIWWADSNSCDSSAGSSGASKFMAISSSAAIMRCRRRAFSQSGRAVSFSSNRSTFFVQSFDNPAYINKSGIFDFRCCQYIPVHQGLLVAGMRQLRSSAGTERVDGAGVIQSAKQFREFPPKLGTTGE